ncbi:MAG: hypothetical protein WB424_08435 [Terracidiphilus sp.]
MDLRELRSELEAIQRHIPDEAQALRERCKGILARLPASGDASSARFTNLVPIQQEVEALSKEMPVLEQMFNSVRDARLIVDALQYDPPTNIEVDLQIAELCRDWHGLLSHILRNVSQANRAKPVIEQVLQLREWALRRRAAAGLIREASDVSRRLSGDKKKIFTELAKTWSQNFCGKEEGVGKQWLSLSQNRLAQLKAEYASAPPTPEEQDAAPAAADDSPEITPEPSMDPQRINLALAECSDLARALGADGDAIADFDRRLQNLVNAPDETGSQIGALKRDVESYLEDLRKLAETAKTEQLERLRRRWNQFLSIYTGRHPQAEESYRQAEAMKAQASSRLTEFFSCVQDALDGIDFVAESDRGPLQKAIRNAISVSVQSIRAVRTEPITIAADAELTRFEQQLPKSESLPGTVSACFDSLDACDWVRQSVIALGEVIASKRNELAARTERLRQLADAIIQTGLDTAENPAAHLFDPQAAGQFQWLDEKEARLSEVELAVEARRVKVQQRLIEEIAKLRQSNREWIQAIRDFAPESKGMAAQEPIPDDFGALHATYNLEMQHKSRIDGFVELAVLRLNEKRAKAVESLQRFLTAPSFEGLPDRETAETYLSDLNDLAELPSASDIDRFQEAYNRITSAEDFVDRLDAPRRRIPEQIHGLETRYRWLSTYDVASYRRGPANRARALLQGIKAAIAREEYDSAEYQIEETDKLIGALEADLRSRIGSEARDLARQLEELMKSTSNEKLIEQARSALERLGDDGQMKPPTRLSRNAARSLLDANHLHGREARRA